MESTLEKNLRSHLCSTSYSARNTSISQFHLLLDKVQFPKHTSLKPVQEFHLKRLSGLSSPVLSTVSGSSSPGSQAKVFPGSAARRCATPSRRNLHSLGRKVALKEDPLSKSST